MIKDDIKDRTNESDVESDVVRVGSNQSQKILIIVLLIVLVGIAYYFYANSSHDEQPNIVKNENIIPNLHEIESKLEKIPESMPIPERIISTPLPPLPQIIEPQNIPKIKPKDPEVKKEKQEKKEDQVSHIPLLPNQSSMNENFPTSFPSIVSSGYPRDRRNVQMLAISGGADSSDQDTITLSNTSSQQGKAAKIGRLDRMITQGKIIDAILETAISTDLQGTIRAIVSRDVYAEAGDTILVPKGSRLIGGYTFDSNIAKARVNINWNRIILPHGIDIAISSPGTDELGRAGISGIIDNKIVNVLFSSILLAGLSISSTYVGQKADKLVGDLSIMEAIKSMTATEIDISALKSIFTSEAKNDSKKDKWKLGIVSVSKLKGATDENDLVKIFKEEVSTQLETRAGIDHITLDIVKTLLSQQSKSPYKNAIEKSINNFDKDMRDIIEKNIDKKPTIYVHQGTALKVFVNQDVVFPPQAILSQ